MTSEQWWRGVVDHDAGESSPTARSRAWAVRHPVLAFTVLAYTISWICWLPLLADRQGWASLSASSYLHLVGGLGPAVAALVVTAAVAGRSGLVDIVRRTVAWRGRLRWIALAVLGPLVVFAAAVLVAAAVDGVLPDLSRFGASTEYPALPLGVFWIASLLFYGFGEEIGWRGFAQPALQRRRSALGAALVVSVIWAGWHLPLFGITATYRAMPAVGFFGFFLSMVAGALVLAWLYLRSRGSILVVALFHAVFDIATTTPTTTTLIPMLMGAVITVAGLAVIPSLARAVVASS
jgi:membrane protease YdiL (CAAX protease family)